MAEEDQVEVDVKALLDSMNQKLEDNFYESEFTGLCSIYKVPPSVRNDNKSDYDPKLISIGPYHGDTKALQAMEPLKWSYLQDLIARSDYDPKLISIGPYQGDTKTLQAMEPLKWSYLQDLIARSEENSLELYVNTILPLEEVIRAYYSEEIDLTPADLVQMMVVDGGFIVEFLIKWYLNEKDDRIGAVKWNLPLLQNDLLLLENQIPFFVLQELFRVSTVPKLKAGVTLLELAATYIAPDQLKSLLKPRPAPGTKQETSSPPPQVINEEAPPQLPFPHHLLHLYHASFEPTPGYDEPAADYSWFAYIFIWPVKMAWRIVSGLVLGLLSLILSCRLHSTCLGWKQIHDDDDDNDKEGQKAPRTTGSATELDEAGVKFCRKKKSGSFLEVTFSGGIMGMPKLPIHEATPTRFRNLLAFEQCYPTAGNYFTSYAVLMNNLIDTPGDVAVLKAGGIIESKLGGDDEVADLFNQLCKGSFLKYEEHYLVKVFKNVRTYCQQDHHRWRAKLVHDYFANPWAIVSLIAAIILLALTVVQTFFTIYPYYHPQTAAAAAPVAA